MPLYIADENFDNALFKGASCAFGVFDGMHAGHRYLIEEALSTRPEGGRAVVITFDIDPDEVFHPERLKKLMRNQDRLRALSCTDADDVVVLPFTPEFYTRSAEEFLESTFGAMAPSHMHVGEDFRFGARALGNVETLRRWGEASGCTIHAHRLVSADDKPITSTRIRLLLEDGKVREAAALLGRPYRLTEKVRRGRGEGTGFGFATANLDVKAHDRVLGEGVYAAYAFVGDDRYKAAVSIGVSPTFEGEATANAEAHLLDFEGDLTDKTISIDFIEYLRPMMKFDSNEELIATVMGNISWVRENL